jgi:hypothetical protein
MEGAADEQRLRVDPFDPCELTEERPSAAWVPMGIIEQESGAAHGEQVAAPWCGASADRLLDLGRSLRRATNPTLRQDNSDENTQSKTRSVARLLPCAGFRGWRSYRLFDDARPVVREISETVVYSAGLGVPPGLDTALCYDCHRWLALLALRSRWLVYEALVDAAIIELFVVSNLFLGPPDRSSVRCPCHASRRDPRLHRSFLAPRSGGGMAFRALCGVGRFCLGAQRRDLCSKLDRHSS